MTSPSQPVILSAVPTYVYQVILRDGSEGPTFEYQQAANEAPLETHPVTGHKVIRLIQSPTLTTKYTPGREKKLSDNSTLEKAGFTKYERDKSTGEFHKTAGRNNDAPDTLRP